jgi:PAS domain S-box-containing protein
MRPRPKKFRGSEPDHRDIARLPERAVRELVKVLRKKQIALEVENKELRGKLFDLHVTGDRYAYLYDCAPVAHLTVNAQGEILEANLTAGNLLGLSRARLVREQFKRFVAAESQEACNTFCHQVFGTDTRCSLELKLADARGRRLVVQVEAVREVMHGKKQCRLSLTDVTALKHAENALLEAAQFNQQIIASANEGIVVNGRDLKHLVWNPFMEQLTGVPAAEVIGKHPLKVFPFLKEAGVIRQMERALTGETAPPVEVRFHVRQSGRSGWASNVSAPLRNVRGEIIGVIGLVNDITERKWAEQQLSRNEARYRGLFASMEEGFLLAELLYNRAGKPVDWRYLDVNPARLKTIGLKREAVVGRTRRELFPQLESHWIEAVFKCALTGSPATIEGFSRSSRRHYVVHLFSPRRGQFAAIFSDITDRKRAEAALLAREAQLHSFVQHAPAGIAIFDRKMNYLVSRIIHNFG